MIYDKSGNVRTCFPVEAPGECADLVANRRGRQIAFSLQSRYPGLRSVVANSAYPRGPHTIDHDGETTVIGDGNLLNREILARRVFNRQDIAFTLAELLGTTLASSSTSKFLNVLAAIRL